MENSKKISFEVIKRLPRYYRYLGELCDSGVTRISSKELSEKMSVTASQIRQDLNCFGGFGQQGYGYNVEALYNEIGKILGLNRGHKMIIVGAGNLGRALASYKSFERRGFKLVGVFDNDPKKIGSYIGEYPILDIKALEDFTKENKPDIAIIAVPKTEAGEVALRLSHLGIRGLLNFSYTDIKVPEGVEIENVHLSDSLMTLSYRIKNKKQ
ncbi:MAG: Redox-sensing transcriptional repressor Rex [Firmicutes bacterium ADurb.Bin193]|nr:MAG: Redox-sensing transcriptional repressor Rex [Firmicutes bacterium ADurb.Bin193]